MRFRASANILIHVEPNAFFSKRELEAIVERAAASVQPWLTTRGRPVNFYVGADCPHVRHETLGGYMPFPHYGLWAQNESSHVPLGPRQLFAYRCYIDSIVKAAADLHVPGVVMVSADVDFTVKIDRYASTDEGSKVIARYS
jgi:hypothetical protein